MKKQLLYLASALLIMGSCDPMEDVYSELEETKLPYSENFSYSLGTADYATASTAALKLAQTDEEKAAANSIKTNNAFNSTYGATKLMNSILAKNFPAFNKSSVAKITYNNYDGKATYLLPYEAAAFYELKDADYTSLGGIVGAVKYFIPTTLPEAGLPIFLKAKYPTAVKDELKLVAYKYSSVQPSTGPQDAIIYTEDFSTFPTTTGTIINLNGWTNELIKGTAGKTWIPKLYSGNYYAQMSANGTPAEEAEAVIITQEIDLTGYEEPTLSFDVNVGYWKHDGLQVMISKDYDGTNYATATWDNVTANFTFPQIPTSGYGTFATAGTMKLTGYTGKIRIAFKYTGNDVAPATETTTYQVDNVMVKGITYAKKKTVTEDVVKYNKFYQFDGTAWKLVTSVNAIQPFEYDAMGNPGPGQYDNFSATVKPADYLNNYFKTMYPFAVENTKKAITYAYYNGSKAVRIADEYILKGGIWTVVSPVVTYTNQFIHNGEAWFFDPTVKFTMVAADYQIIVNHVLAIDPTWGYTDKSREFYYGAASRYSNFDLRVSTRKAPVVIAGFDGLSDADAIKLMWKRLPEAVNILLEAKFPAAVPQADGIDVNYEVTFYTYENDLSSAYYKIKFQCISTGKFKLIEDSKKI